MQVLIEPIETGFRASSGKPFDASAEGATSEEALERLREMLSRRLQNGARIVELKVLGEEVVQENPWLKMAGIFKDDPLFDAWQEAIREYRRQRDEEDDVAP